MRNLSAYCRSLVCDNSLSLLLSGLCLAFASLIIMCFSTSLSIFTLECIDLLGCFIFIFFMTFPMFLAIVSLPLCHFLWDSPDMVFHLMVAHRSLRLCSFYLFFFFLLLRFKYLLSLIHISEPTRRVDGSRMPSSA